MALTTLNAPVPLMPMLPGITVITSSIGSDNTFTFDAAADKMGFVFQANSTTPPDQIKFRCTGYTSTGTIDVTLETVDATTGAPTGTPVTNSATGSVSVASTGTKTATGLSGTAVLVVGTIYAVVLTAAAGFAGSFIVLRTTGVNAAMGMPYALTKDSAGAWTKATTMNFGHAIGFFTAAGASIHMSGFAGAYTASFTAFTDSSNPDERGSRFVAPAAATLMGVIVTLYAGTPADTSSFILSLYSSHTSGSPVQEATVTFDGDVLAAGSFRVLRFAAPFTLVAGTTYALVAKATSSVGINLVKHVYATTAEMGCYMADDFYATERNNASGAFTDVNTAAYSVYPLLSAIDDGAGGAGGGGPLVGGRLVI